MSFTWLEQGIVHVNSIRVIWRHPRGKNRSDDKEKNDLIKVAEKIIHRYIAKRRRLPDRRHLPRIAPGDGIAVRASERLR